MPTTRARATSSRTRSRVKVTQAFTRTIVGLRPADPGVPVVTGWNLVGVAGHGLDEPGVD